MTLPALTKPDLTDYVVTMSPLGKTPPTAPIVSATPTRMSSLASLVERLNGVESIFREARQAATEANDQQIELQLRTEQAEAERARLEVELAQARGQLEALDRVPRWVKRMFGASSF